MAEETQNTNSTILKIEQYVEENSKNVAIGSGVVVLVIAAVLFVFFKYLPDENLKAQKAIYMAEFAFAKDSFNVALYGNGTTKGFADVAKKYSWTKTGNLANYYAGISALNLKKYSDAVTYLDKFSTSDPIIGALKLNALGDANMELGKTEEGLKYYQKAADFSSNDGYTPYFLLKTGMAYEKQKKYADAKKQYEKVRDQFPSSDEARDIEKYIARVSGESSI